MMMIFILFGRLSTLCSGGGGERHLIRAQINFNGCHGVVGGGEMKWARLDCLVCRGFK